MSIEVRAPFGVDPPRTISNIGVAAAGVTAVEYGDAINHVTKLTLDTTLPAIAGGANLAVGKLLYTLPVGAQVISASQMNIALTAADGNIDADTPEVGLGSVIASGVVDVLSGTATFEDILTGQVATDCAGTAITAAVGTILATNTGGVKAVFLNVADGWAAGGEAACPVTGTVVIHWSQLTPIN